MPKSESIYNIKDNFYDAIVTAFQALKAAENGHGWNRPIEDLNGCALKLLAPGFVEIVHTRYVVCNPYQMDIKEKSGAKEFLDEVARELKKHFRKVAKKTLKMKKHREDQDVQLYSKLSPDAWGSTYGTMVGRYTITTRRVYKVEADNLEIED